MLALLSPAKKLDFKPLRDEVGHSAPLLVDETNTLVALMKRQSRMALAQMMRLSDSLADVNYQRFQAFRALPDDEGKQAVLAFAGDTYQGLNAASLSKDDLLFAQDHLRILSGLYGMLRPLDRIQPYRLEMGTRLANERGATLYDFWKEVLTALLERDLAAMKTPPVVVVLASEEYAAAIDRKTLQARIITPSFRLFKGASLRSPGMAVKRARGMMARYLVVNRLSDPEKLKEFREGGYIFRPDLSEGDRWEFVKDDVPS